MPRALSTGSGAEIQNTVVIGGLITSTLLTLIVLPVIYSWLTQQDNIIRCLKSEGVVNSTNKATENTCFTLHT